MVTIGRAGDESLETLSHLAAALCSAVPVTVGDSALLDVELLLPTRLLASCISSVLVCLLPTEPRPLVVDEYLSRPDPWLGQSKAVVSFYGECIARARLPRDVPSLYLTVSDHHMLYAFSAREELLAHLLRAGVAERNTNPCEQKLSFRLTVLAVVLYLLCRSAGAD